MRKAYKYSGAPPVPALEDKDLEALRDEIAVARKMWEEDSRGKDIGTCVLGAGIACWHVARGCRNAREKVLIGSPGQSDCSDTRRRAEEYLRERLSKLGVEVFFNYGMMD
jgi:hypothetical protein